MARDRLAAMRAQQGGTTTDYPFSPSYPTQASGGDGGYQSRRANPYAQQDDRAYEMSDVRDSRTQLAPNSNGDSMAAFYSEANGLRTFNDNVSRIGDLHSRSLNNTDDSAAQRNASQLDALIEETSELSTNLKNRIKDLERQGASGRDGQIRKQQTALVKSKFVEAIQNYQTVEQQYRTKYKQRMERQFKIVKPDATPEEVRAVVNDDQGGQIFSQALLNSNRYGASKAAYREVQERHEDIKRIEKTLAELAQLFNDMSVLVEQQDETINAIETQAHSVVQDTEAGLGYTEKAVVSARSARKKRWICFFIFLILLIIVAIIIAVVLAPARSTTSAQTSMPGKKRCQFQIGTESQCNSAALRIVGECPHCRAQFCGTHRLPEHHSCTNLEDCRQQAFERNKTKLERLSTLTVTVTVPSCPLFFFATIKPPMWTTHFRASLTPYTHNILPHNVPLAPPDSIFKLTAAYKADTFEKKVNLGVGAYRDDDNKPWVLPVVQKDPKLIAAIGLFQASELILKDTSLDHEYLPITGLPSFTSAAAKLILGAASPAIQEDRAVSVQTISGTGANHLGALFLSRFYEWNGAPKVYLSNPTWANHHAIFRNVGIEPVDYPYYDPKTIGLDFSGFAGAIQDAPERSVFLIHACAHNPTGVDPTEGQWKGIAQLILAKKHFVFFDCAYQGFASGDLDKDAWASFAKNAGLYGERVGALHVVPATKEAGERVKSQLSVLQRSEISNPPTYGARIVSMILNDEALFKEWKRDIKTMAGRIIDMREELYRILTEELKTPGNWEHILNQIGMFSFTGINEKQSKKLVEEEHVYLTTNGRISMAGLNRSNIGYFAEKLDKVVRYTS
ncbi:hypothetical protein H0H93_012144 [Arthromyces matolae]|nr:hypothetical protein H0H93_012144 [Arthromyces matolae]